MTNDPVPRLPAGPLSAESAFVVHLTASQAAPEMVCGRVEHITSGHAARFASVAELIGFMRQTLAILAAFAVLAGLPLRAAARTDSTCLTGNDPSVANDAVEIAALRLAIDTACPCASFDSGKGRAHADYLRCVKGAIGAAIDGGRLRSACKARVKDALQDSICGLKPALQAVPCIETNARGRIHCAVRSAGACVSKPGHYARVACPQSATCIDAGDGNADYLVDGLDSGACVALSSPTPTATVTASSTATPPATATASSTSTATNTAINTATQTAVPTGTPADTATATSEPSDTPASSPTDTAIDTATPTATPTFTSAVCTHDGIIIPHVDVNADVDLDSPPLPPDPAASLCRPQTSLAGGCALNPLDGSVTNVFDASATIDQARCPGDPPPSYHWEIFRPPGLGSSRYASSGISGYHDPVLTILPSSLPALQGTTAGQDVFWRVGLTITSNVGSHQSTQVFFRFDYQQSILTLTMSTDCQRIGHLQGDECTIEGINGLPATEPW